MFAVRRPLVPAVFLVSSVLIASAMHARGASGEEPKADAGASTAPTTTTTAASAASAAPAPSNGTPNAHPSSPSSHVTITTADGRTVRCREQAAQPFLIRGNWFPKSKDADVIKAGRKMLEDSVRYRTEKYGYFEGFGNPKANAHPPKFYAKSTSFMGMPLQVHERIIPALKCVEAALKATPAGDEYKPRAAGGIRFKNTYRGVEVSNHVYGIAIDIEPDKNSCCGCVAPWPDHPLCKAKNKTVWERMAMPKSWVEVFERYGFYWLGHDVLQDTMHFEFLGDPEKITETAAL
ncbi:hypothetical protein AKJ09_10307 [Labilithrix luteola]|uniref:Peptidase M15C domain-containing protein n=1 Tax=Labilithrix luteola TaxID=1391654 RepID=A0A0K1QD18_9BACT|nr:M15 family metallopeptidase [Labilithrix luteola]AKV03644.1 hypothetical protein AKJ09_10307 [Labilithrix luteola]